MRTNFHSCEWCGNDTLSYLCPACQADADAALRIAQTEYARRQSFKRLDDPPIIGYHERPGDQLALGPSDD